MSHEWLTIDMGQRASSSDSDVIVTTSDFVRQFGRWQERATREPVYILHRGRPRFVMTSVETMQQLCAHRTGAPPAVAAGDDGALLDLVSEIMLLIDRDLRIVQSSAAARRYFRMAPDYGVPVSRLIDGGGNLLLDRAMRRVLATGLGETIEVAGPYAARQLAFSILPHPFGIAAVARDVTVIDDLGTARAAHDAQRTALCAMGNAATAQLNLRGYMEAQPFGFVDLTGLTDQALIGVRFASLIVRQSRVAVADAIDQVIGTAQPVAIDAAILFNGQAERPVRIGMAPIRTGVPVEGVAIAVVAHAGNPSGDASAGGKTPGPADDAASGAVAGTPANAARPH